MAKTTKKAEPAAKTTEAVESKSAEKAAPKTAKTKTAAKIGRAHV